MREAIKRLLGVPALQPVSHGLHRMLAWRTPNGRRHPIDRLYGIATSGELPGYLLKSGGAGADLTAYAGCIPSIIRAALRSIPDVSSATFLDIGCGKGRALAVASEFPFRRLTGWELNPRLGATARVNMAAMRRRKSGLPPADVVVGDASAPSLPEGDIVCFLYHPFGPASMAKLATLLAAATGDRRIFVVSENPVNGAIFDQSPAFRRWFALRTPIAPEEEGFGPDAEESIIVWASGRAGPSPHRADQAIRVLDPAWRAELADERTDRS